jgi:hypothetical protein
MNAGGREEDPEREGRRRVHDDRVAPSEESRAAEHDDEDDALERLVDLLVAIGLEALSEDDE